MAGLAPAISQRRHLARVVEYWRKKNSTTVGQYWIIRKLGLVCVVCSQGSLWSGKRALGHSYCLSVESFIFCKLTATLLHLSTEWHGRLQSWLLGTHHLAFQPFAPYDAVSHWTSKSHLTKTSFTFSKSFSSFHPSVLFWILVPTNFKVWPLAKVLPSPLCAFLCWTQLGQLWTPHQTLEYA